MNRRSFLQWLGVSSLSLLLPKIGEEMQLEDVWEKIANNARLTPEELSFLRQSARETQLRNSFVSGLQSGNSKTTSVRSTFGDFDIPPTNGGWIGWSKLTSVSYPQDLSASNTFTVISSGFTEQVLNPQSAVKWYDKSTGKLDFTSSFTSASPKLISMSGNYMVSSPSTVCQLNLYIKRKSDNTQVAAAALVKDTASSDVGGFPYSFVYSVNLASLGASPSDIYLEFQGKATYGTPSAGVALDVLFFRTV